MNFKADLMGRPLPTLSVSIKHTHAPIHTRALSQSLEQISFRPATCLDSSHPHPPRGTVKMTMFHHLLFELLLLLWEPDWFSIPLLQRRNVIIFVLRLVCQADVICRFWLFPQEWRWKLQIIFVPDISKRFLSCQSCFLSLRSSKHGRIRK